MELRALVWVTALILVATTAIMWWCLNPSNGLHTQCWVINLAKNTERLRRFSTFYEHSDLSSIPLFRFNAIVGKELNAAQYLTPNAYTVLRDTEQRGYRTKHYQLTRGAIGCYLSHIAIYRKLLADDKHDYYVIFEDDAVLAAYSKRSIAKAVSKAPADWDIINLAPARKVVRKQSRYFEKLEFFWGTSAYIIHKRGAAKMVADFEAKPISMQIDSKMSLMIAQGRLNVYGFREPAVRGQGQMGTDIQMPIAHVPDVDPFVLEEL